MGARAPGQRAVSQSKSMTAPIGGLNARDSLAAMPPEDAVILDNFFPTTTTVDLRRGAENWSTGYPANVESLMPYIKASTKYLFAASGTAFYDATSSGAVGAAVVTGLSNARWQSANMETPAGQYFYAVNGADKPRFYDGVAWVAVDGGTTPAISGVTTSLLVHLNVYKERLYFVEINSFRIWYLPVNSIGGAAQSFDLGSIFKLGGYLMAMATWTVDNAAGVNEYAVFITSEGEVAMYQGYDPSTSGTWSLIGMFRIGRPVGRRCFEKVGSDLIVITSDGAFPLSKALLTDRSQLQDAISAKIIQLINTDIALYKGNFGWDIKLFPLGNKLFINVPQYEGKTQYQYVMNTITGAWCRFINLNANCWCVLEDRIFYGGNLGSSPNTGYVALAETGSTDFDDPVTGEVKTAFQYFDAPGRLKRFMMVRPIFMAPGTIRPALRMDIDFENATPTTYGSFTPGAGTPWDTALWDTFLWGGTDAIRKDWQAASGLGYAGALHMRIQNSDSVSWMSVDYVYEYGAII